MLEDLRTALAAHDWQNGDTPPAVDFELFFEGNDEEESIAPNQWGEGRPPIREIYERFKVIAERKDVECVLVGLHSDWNDSMFADGFPPAENVHIFSSAKTSEVEGWLQGLLCDGVLSGWPYGKPKNAPEPSPGFKIHSVCWD